MHKSYYFECTVILKCGRKKQLHEHESSPNLVSIGLQVPSLSCLVSIYGEIMQDVFFHMGAPECMIATCIYVTKYLLCMLIWFSRLEIFIKAVYESNYNVSMLSKSHLLQPKNSIPGSGTFNLTNFVHSWMCATISNLQKGFDKLINFYIYTLITFLFFFRLWDILLRGESRTVGDGDPAETVVRNIKNFQLMLRRKCLI